DVSAPWPDPSRPLGRRNRPLWAIAGARPPDVSERDQRPLPARHAAEGQNARLVPLGDAMGPGPGTCPNRTRLARSVRDASDACRRVEPELLEARQEARLAPPH